MRDSTEYWVLNGERTRDSFANDCLEFTFSQGNDGNYLVNIGEPFFSDEFWNPGYLAMQTNPSIDAVGGGS